MIDGAARERLRAHETRLACSARKLAVASLPPDTAHGTFVAPQVWAIDNIAFLQEEVFGPILHIVRYEDGALDEVIATINATGFGLTGGVHSRIERVAQRVEAGLRVGNLYVNRSMIGAVVGVQPFGGEGLSGTGPKAGGPHYLPRFALERHICTNLAAAGGNAALFTGDA